MNLNINTLNSKLVDMTSNINKAKEIRVSTVRTVVSDIISYATEHKDLFVNKKTAIALFIKQNIESGEVDNYTKRALKVAKLHLVDNYKVKFDLLTLAQTEKVMTFNKNTINALMKLEDDEYIIACKELIKLARSLDDFPEKYSVRKKHKTYKRFKPLISIL